MVAGLLESARSHEAEKKNADSQKPNGPTASIVNPLKYLQKEVLAALKTSQKYSSEEINDILSSMTIQ